MHFLASGYSNCLKNTLKFYETVSGTYSNPGSEKSDKSKHCVTEKRRHHEFRVKNVLSQLDTQTN